MRLIDADELLKHEHEADRMGAMLVVGKGYILNAPSIEIVLCSALDKEKPKDCIVHEMTNGIFLECPKCGYWQKEKALKFYCPNCGQRIK